MTKSSGENPPRLDRYDAIVLELVKNHEKLSKSDAPKYGVMESTFQVHAKKLVAIGLLQEIPEKVVDGRGRPRVMYSLPEKETTKHERTRPTGRR